MPCARSSAGYCPWCWSARHPTAESAPDKSQFWLEPGRPAANTAANMSSQRTQVTSGPVTIRLEVPEPTPPPAASAEAPHESAHLSEPFSSILEEIASEL